MPVTEAERHLLDQVSLDLPWALVETFSTTPRWRPEDVNRAAGILVDRLKDAGVPFEVHQPDIYLSVPYGASVMAGGVTCRAKPPSSSLSVPGGQTAALVALEANPKALRSYNRDVATLFGGSITSVAAVKRLVAGKFVVMQGFGNPALTSLVEEWGGAGLIACNRGPTCTGAPARPSGAARTCTTGRASPASPWSPSTTGTGSA